ATQTNGAATGSESSLTTALAREGRLLSRINELDAQNKQLQTSEERLRHSLENTGRTNAQIIEAYQTLLVAAADGFLLLDEQDRVLEANEAYCAMSGFTKEELLKLSASDFEVHLHGESKIRLDAQREAQAARYETRHRRKNGTEYWVEVSIGVLSGARTRTVAIVRDVTDREQQRVASQRAQRMQELSLEAALELCTRSDLVDEAGIARRATELAASLTDSPLAFFCAVDATRNAPQLTALFETAKNVAVSPSGDARYLAADGLAARTLRSGRPFISEDAQPSETLNGLPAQQRTLLLPIVDPGTAGGEPLGLLAVANRSTAYTTADQALLGRMSEALGGVLRSKRAHSQTLIAAQRAEVALQGIIEGLSRVGERHDPYTTGGPRRVAALAVALARELQLTQTQQNALRIAGLLHIVGNIAIPAALFGKPSQLTAPELALVRTHVDEGHNILSEIEFGGPVAEIVYQHRERMDGSGYPRGLRGDDILIEARVLAVADVVEAMCAARPHRAAPGVDAALKEIEAGRDQRYDARVVDACLRLFREQGFVLPE
ncbi:MAG: PAS domain S-box protein, partial [Candidatus Obscuribacterales bacterium]|nr:PAS domain S-box protein [Steroidobacteraceae bacterium]